MAWHLIYRGVRSEGVHMASRRERQQQHWTLAWLTYAAVRWGMKEEKVSPL